MISGSAIEFVEDVLAQLRNTDKAKDDLFRNIRAVEELKEDAEAKLVAAQDNRFSVQRKLYAAVTLINDVYRDYRGINFNTKAGRKRADKMLEQMCGFQSESAIHIANTERGWVAKRE